MKLFLAFAALALVNTLAVAIFLNWPLNVSFAILALLVYVVVDMRRYPVEG